MSSPKWDPGKYKKHSQNQYKWAIELIAGLAISNKEKLLDIGCGDGKVTAKLAETFPGASVIGIDSSKKMIDFASKSFPENIYANLKFMHLDAMDVDKVFSGEFDLIFSNAALHWIIDHGTLLKKIFKALKPGGKLVVQMGGKGNAKDVFAVLNGLIESDNWKNFFSDFTFPYGFYSPCEYEPWLKEAGFTIHTIELKPKLMIHKNIDEFKGWIETTWFPYINRVPDEKRELFISMIAERYTEKFPPKKDERIEVVMQRLEVMAEKPEKYMDTESFVKDRVRKYYWKDDINCATTVLKILSEIFHIDLDSQLIASAVGMHGAGEFGAQCGLVEGTLMFLGIFGNEKRLTDREIIALCYKFAEKFEKEFGSLLCSTLRPQGFKPDNPPHLCEELTVKGVLFSIDFMFDNFENLKEMEVDI